MQQYIVLLLALVCQAGQVQATPAISPEQMQAVYEEIKTPYKYGVVIPAPAGKKVDCPTVFRHDGHWYMVYVQMEKKPQDGYTTQLARSKDLLRWTTLGTIVERGAANSWDQANAGGGIALADTQWAGQGTLGSFEGRYWLTYIGGDKFGYESIPLCIGLASTDDPSAARPWHRRGAPIMTVHDADARDFESGTLYKSFVMEDPDASLGARFIMFYNAKPAHGNEQIAMAVSEDLHIWRRYGDGPVIVNRKQSTPNRGAISGDPQIVRMKDLWVMFYFGAFWKPKAFDTFAVSRDLVHWTKWDGPHLIEPSEPWDQTFAHKPWILKHEGVVYHFYCAVGDQGRVIALATSKPMGKKEE